MTDHPAFVVLKDAATLSVRTSLGVVSLVCKGGEVTFFVPPGVKVEAVQEGGPVHPEASGPQ